MEQVIDETALGQNNKTLSPRAQELVASTTGWMKFAAIAGMVFSALSLIGAIGGMMLQNQSSSYFQRRNSFSSPSLNLLGGAIGIISAYFLLMSAIYLSRYTQGKSNRDLLGAARNQRIYYIISGVMIILYFVFGIYLGLTYRD